MIEEKIYSEIVELIEERIIGYYEIGRLLVEAQGKVFRAIYDGK